MIQWTGIALFCINVMLIAQPSAVVQAGIPEKMNWFSDAKLGIFIHYGIYAVNGTAESWAFYDNEVSYRTT